MPNETGTKSTTFWLITGFLVSLAGYHLLLYATPREDFYRILLLFSVLGMVYLFALSINRPQHLNAMLVLAILLRCSLLWAVPELSDDYFRFIWDGHLWHLGISPFAYLPSELIGQPDFASIAWHQQLFQGLNSPDYFTIYPPFSQLVFVLGTYLFPENIIGNIIVMRVIIILCEIGTIYFLLKILKQYQLPSRHVLIYALNPLVIIELTGNLHFEALMIFLVTLAIWCFKKGNWMWSAVALGAAVSTKLLPLIFLPLLWGRLPLKRLMAYYGLTGITIVVCFLPMLDQELLSGMSSSLSLYFQKFEFNASIYYVIREIGFAYTGYNIIQSAGKYLALATLLVVVLLAWKSPQKMTWPQAMLWALMTYLVLSTTVHPWYITSLVFLGTLTSFRFPLIWSMLVMVTYAGYTADGYQENLWLVTAEYLGVFIFLATELSAGGTNLFINKSVNIGHEIPTT